MKNIIFTILFFFLCFGSLFLNEPAFVEAQVAPKRYAALFTGMTLIVTLVVSSFFGKVKISFPVCCSIITALCSWQALYGISQYLQILPAFEGHRVTGSFDNPAGFAASLCAGFPFMFYFIRKEYTWRRWISLSAVIIIVMAIILSASRAGMVSLFVTGMIFLFYRIRVQAKRKIIWSMASIAIVLSGLYFLKKDSADGRLLIWRCSLEMVKDKPIPGFGQGGFKAHYMDYQADYFEKHPDSQYVMLADNVNRPFNEYLSLLVDYGITGLILFLACAWFLWKCYRRKGNRNIAGRISIGCLLSVAVFAFFSYPLTYPFVWIMLALSIFTIIYQAKISIRVPLSINTSLKLLAIPIIIVSGIFIYRQMEAERLWRKIAHQSLAGQTEQVLPVYKQLHQQLSHNELFLYNYAAELNVTGRYSGSLKIAQECEQWWADYELQLLIADNYQQMKQYPKAEQHYLKAANMCPVKFVPLYSLFDLYLTTGEKDKATAIAGKIMNKPVKVMSPTIWQIKYDVEQKMKRKEDVKAENPK
jgi:O-antigen ligase